MKYSLPRLRALFWSLLAFATILVQWFTIDRGSTLPAYLNSLANFFSYFTIETNLLIAVWFFARALSRERDWWGNSPAVRLSLTTYGLVTVMVYWLLLAGTEHPEGIRAAANYGLHLVLPLAFFGEWAFDRPARRATWISWAWAAFFPAVYCAYCLVRGELTGWYPYFFVNLPKQGVPLTAAYVLGLSGFFLLVAALAGLIWNRLLSPPSDSQATAPKPSS